MIPSTALRYPSSTRALFDVAPSDVLARCDGLMGDVEREDAPQLRRPSSRRDSLPILSDEAQSQTHGKRKMQKFSKKFLRVPYPCESIVPRAHRTLAPRAARCRSPGEAPRSPGPEIAPRGSPFVRFEHPRAAPMPVARRPSERTAADGQRTATSPSRARPRGRFSRSFQGFCNDPIRAATSRRGYRRRERGLTFGATPWPAMENGGVAKGPHHRPQTIVARRCVEESCTRCHEVA